MKIIFYILLLLLIFTFTFPLVFAEGKKVDVSVVVENNSSSNFQNSYDSSNIIGSSVTSGKNNSIPDSKTSINESEINQSYDKSVNEMFSFKSSSLWVIPIIFSVFTILFIITYEIMLNFKKKRVSKRKRASVKHKK